jgi:hypothetical protein
MSRYAVKVLVRNLDNEGGDDSGDAIVHAEIIASSPFLAAHLRGEIRKFDFVGPEPKLEDRIVAANATGQSDLHSVRSELH